MRLRTTKTEPARRSLFESAQRDVVPTETSIGQAFWRLTLVGWIALVVLIASPSDKWLGQGRAMASDFSGRKDTDGHWTYCCVILASIEMVHPDKNDEMTVILHPLGTITGDFDAGHGRHLVLHCDAVDGLQPGEDVVLVLFDAAIFSRIKPKESTWVIQDGTHEYMPNFLPVARVSGFSDPKVGRILDAIQDLRLKPPQISDYRKNYWSTHCLVYGEVKAFENASSPHRCKLAFHPLATMAGDFDAAGANSFEFVMDYRSLHQLLDERMNDLPREGDRMLFLLSTAQDKSGWRIAYERCGFMPNAHDPMCLVDRLSTKEITGILRVVQRAARDVGTATEGVGN
jgi:hypothetical protein